MLIMRGCAHLVDVNGAFLLGDFEDDPVTHKQRHVFMEILQGFENLVPDWC
jgi:hypothetical protein